MKKLLSLLLISVFVFSLSACQSKVTQTDKDTVGGTVSNSADKKDPEYSSGITDNNVYTSKFAGFKITSPGGTWEFKDEATILALMDITADETDIFSDDEKMLEIAKKTTIYDAMLSDAQTGSNIIVMYENLSVTNSLLISEKQYCEILKNQLSSTDSYTIGESYKIKLVGKDYYRLDVSTTIDSITVNQSYIIRKIGKYMLAVCITAGAGSSQTVDTILTMFSAIDES